MAKARNELGFAEDFDVVLVNSDLEKAIQEAKEIVTQFLNT
jgi:guanylate kinase